MSDKIVDLDVMFPDSEVIQFTGQQDKQKYTVKMWIPSEIAMKYIKVGNDPEVDAEEVGLNIVYEFLKMQHPHMDEKWCKLNIPYSYIAYIAHALKDEILGSYDIIAKKSGGKSSGKK